MNEKLENMMTNNIANTVALTCVIVSLAFVSFGVEQGSGHLDDRTLLISDGSRFVPKDFFPTNAPGLTYATFGQVQALADLGFIVVNQMIRRILVKPLASLAAHVDRISLGTAEGKPLPVIATDEIGSLARSVTRLRTSLSKAIHAAEETHGE